MANQWSCHRLDDVVAAPARLQGRTGADWSGSICDQSCDLLRTRRPVVALFIHLTVFHSVFVKYPFDAPGPTYEPAIIYLAIAIVFVFTGPGILSQDLRKDDFRLEK